MPELPEVEATRRHLEAPLAGASITRVEVRRDRMVRRQARSSDFADRLVARRVTAIGRHGKFLLTRLEGDVTWVTHLGMSGRIQLANPGEEEADHTNVVVATDRSAEVRLVDPRTFGFVAAYLPDELASGPLGLLGPDAWDDLPEAPDLATRMAGRTAAVKPLLLDQRFLAGLGNIYADEVLHGARIRPERPAGSLAAAEVAALRDEIPRVLAAGIADGGTSLDDLAYLLPDGRAGVHVGRLAVYGREGLPCRRCGAPVRRVVLRARSAFFCEVCQS
jgi:formamidopyrimidine-DNA glycosylase